MKMGKTTVFPHFFSKIMSLYEENEYILYKNFDLLEKNCVPFFGNRIDSLFAFFITRWLQF